MWGVGLCLGLTGCAMTERRVVLGPEGNVPGSASVLAAHSQGRFRPPVNPVAPCGCGQVQPPLTLYGPQGPSDPSSQSPSSKTALARFLPSIQDHQGAENPREAVRPDPLGVRTIPIEPTVLLDKRMVRAARDDLSSDRPAIEDRETPPAPAPNDPVAHVDIAALTPAPTSTPPASEPSPGGMPAAAVEPTGEASNPMPKQAEAQTQPQKEPTENPTLPAPGPAITLEFDGDPTLAGRPRLASDGTLVPGPRPRFEGETVATYGPEPTFPASYAADGGAPTSVPKTREVWPTRRPWRPTVFSRIFQRYRKDEGAR